MISILECSGMFQESPCVFLKQVTLHFILTQEEEKTDCGHEGTFEGDEAVLDLGRAGTYTGVVSSHL